MNDGLQGPNRIGRDVPEHLLLSYLFRIRIRKIETLSE